MALRYIRVGSLEQLPAGKVKGVRPWPGYRMAICNVEGTVFAIDDVCTHAGGIMHYGDMIRDEIQCPVHLASFNVKTGELTEGPKCEAMRTYPVRMDGEHIEVGIEEK